MGDSVTLKCTACKSTFPPGKFSLLFIGRGIEIETIGLPSYCKECNQFMATTAENPYCKKCNSLIQLLGDFKIERLKTFNKKSHPDNFLCDWEVINNRDLSLTKEELISKSKLSFLDLILIKLKKHWKESFCLVFKLGMNKYYYCPNCRSYALTMYPAFVSWD